MPTSNKNTYRSKNYPNSKRLRFIENCNNYQSREQKDCIGNWSVRVAVDVWHRRVFRIREAIKAFRKDASAHADATEIKFDAPLTAEKVLMNLYKM